MFAAPLRKANVKSEVRTGKKARSRIEEEFGPPISPEEQRANLSELEQKLNAEMKCHAGKNQVFLRSLLTGNGTTEPRIALRCPLRRDIGLNPTVFYEHIRDVCCTNPELCEAYRNFMDRFVET